MRAESGERRTAMTLLESGSINGQRDRAYDAREHQVTFTWMKS